MAKGSAEAPAGFQLRIELKEVLPPVWRRVLVPGSITLPGLHRVFQEVMGWEKCPLHRFRFKDKEYGIPDPEYPTEIRNERGRRLREFLREEGETFGYQYDFGDDREHDVVVEQIVTGAEVTEAVCLAGERACPPEDVGGPPGYMDYLEAMRDPSHPEHEQVVEWRGGGHRSNRNGSTRQRPTGGCPYCPGVAGGGRCRDI